MIKYALMNCDGYYFHEYGWAGDLESAKLWDRYESEIPKGLLLRLTNAQLIKITYEIKSIEKIEE